MAATFHDYRIVELDRFWGESFRQPGMGLMTVAVIGSDECRWAIPVRLTLPDGRELRDDARIAIRVSRPETGPGFETELLVDGEAWPLSGLLSGPPAEVLLLDAAGTV